MQDSWLLNKILNVSPGSPRLKLAWRVKKSLFWQDSCSLADQSGSLSTTRYVRFRNIERDHFVSLDWDFFWKLIKNKTRSLQKWKNWRKDHENHRLLHFRSLKKMLTQGTIQRLTLKKNRHRRKTASSRICNLPYWWKNLLIFGRTARHRIFYVTLCFETKRDKYEMGNWSLGNFTKINSIDHGESLMSWQI